MWTVLILKKTLTWVHPKLQEGAPHLGPKRGLLSKTGGGKLVSEETYMLTKQEISLCVCWEVGWGGWCPGGDCKVTGVQENYSAMWLVALHFIVMGSVSRLSLANHSDPGSFLVAHAFLRQDGGRRESFQEVVGHVTSPFDLSRILPVGGGSLLAPYSSPGPPVLK